MTLLRLERRYAAAPERNLRTGRRDRLQREFHQAEALGSSPRLQTRLRVVKEASGTMDGGTVSSSITRSTETRDEPVSPLTWLKLGLDAEPVADLAAQL